jgi:CBS-domain-containing membrane protein
MVDVVGGIFQRIRFSYLQKRYNSLFLLAAFSLINGVLSIGIMSAVALATDAPFIFPSLGPTAFLFFYTPTAPAASPRNTIIGHLIGASVGWLSLAVFGLLDEGPAVAVGVSSARIGAAALSLGLTSGLMVLAKAPHPPAGATTLIVSLGIMRELWQMGVLMAAVVLLTMQAFTINRAAGIPYPLWRAKAP